MAILPEATRLWPFCFWLFCSSQDPIAIARKDADPTWMKGVDWRHPRWMDSECRGWALHTHTPTNRTTRSAEFWRELIDRRPSRPLRGQQRANQQFLDDYLFAYRCGIFAGQVAVTSGVSFC